MRKLLAPWHAAAAQEEFTATVVDLLREMMRVTASQAETNARMQASIEQITTMFFGGNALPDRWINDEDGQMMADMLLRMQAENEGGKGH